MTDEYWAHTGVDKASGRSTSHALAAHLQEVGRLAAGFTSAAHVWGELAGRWHDLGKYRQGFQKYIRASSDAHIEGKLPPSSDKTHSAAGALHAIQLFEQRFGREGALMGRMLAYVIAGHHAGLADWVASLETRLLGTGATASEKEYGEARTACEAVHPFLLTLPADFDLRSACLRIPGVQSGNPLAWSLWIRMLFSSLVDADFLDTERFMNAGQSDARDAFSPIEQYVAQLERHLNDVTTRVRLEGRADTPVMRERAAVLQSCQEHALLPSGVFSLEVPTGGGKTLSSLAFALRHASAHGKRRVIYAIPYTSIIEQTADVFASIFGRDAVVEHHSQADPENDSQETMATRLACENWSAPLVVTTNVQLFESLFAARTSRCRKLHNLADSVIVLDEAQLLPAEFLQPVLDTLLLLVQHYGVTLLLCTATQPVLTDNQRFDPRRNLRGLPAPTQIVSNRGALFDALDRVTIAWPSNLHETGSLSDVGAQIAGHDCVLAVVNTRADAAELLAAVDSASGDRALHLSAAMCGQHRADVIAEIRTRLAARTSGTDLRPLRVVSTQLVEAGVDIDFPVVYRALAGLDSIAQAAGRCNREARLPHKGRVVVFVRDIPGPLAALRYGVQATRATLGDARPSNLRPQHFEAYFRHYYNQFDSHDAHGIVDLLRNNPDLSLNFREASRRFRLIDDKDQVSIIVPYASHSPDARSVAPLLDRLRRKDSDRWLLRALQRYVVQVRRSAVEPWQRTGDAEELLPGLFVLTNAALYSPRVGLLRSSDLLALECLVQ